MLGHLGMTPLLKPSSMRLGRSEVVIICLDQHVANLIQEKEGTQQFYTSFVSENRYNLFGLVVSTLLKNMSSSVGMMKFPAFEKIMF